MFDKEMVSKVIEGIVWLNNAMGVWAWIFPILFAMAVLWQLVRCYRHPSPANSRLLMAIYGVIYLYSGAAIFVGIDYMGNMAYVGAVALWSVGVIVLLDAVFGWTHVRLPENRPLRYLSLFLILGGIFLYPLLEVATGFVYPRMVLFGAECPTTISLIGLLIGSIPRVNRPLLILVSLNAIFTGTSFAINGAVFDFFYAAAGVLGVLVMIVYFQEIFLTPKGKTDSD